MKLLREILSIPFMVVGVTVLRVAEFVAGSKMAFRGKDYLAKTKAICTECGHSGYINKKPKPKDIIDLA